jgi:putative heme-binding domain-containing protein
MELFVRGTRNILAVGISPMLDLFTRDNTNDGDDWNDRLSFLPAGAHMGYPTLFRNFADEIIPTMVDFGGGSPIGVIYVDEPALPAAWARGLYTSEWGRNDISLHPLTATGAGWKTEMKETKQFMKMPRATDLEVDGAGHLYASSWDGAQFTYNGPNVGFLVRLTAKSAKPITVPDFAQLSATELAAYIGNASGVWRFAAQRELLKRGEQSGVADVLRGIVARSDNPGARTAAIFTLKLLLGAKSHAALLGFAADARVRETALKALADDPATIADVATKPFVDALADTDPRVRLQAVTGLARLGKTDVAPALVRRTADADPVIAHVAVSALGTLRAADACFAALDGADQTLHTGALRVLQSLHEPAVADGLIQRLATNNPGLHRGIFNALARLDTKEAAYTDPKMWWGTRPDTSGPVYKPERWASSDAIEAALKRALEAAEGGEAQLMVTALLRTKVSFPGFSELMLAKAGRDAASRLDVITPLVSPKAPAPAALLDAVKTIAASGTEAVDARVRAARLLVSLYDKNTDAVTDAFVALSAGELPAPLATVWNEFVRDSRHARRAAAFSGFVRDADPAKRRLGAAVLVNLVASPLGNRGGGGGGGGKRGGGQRPTLDSLWNEPLATAALLRAIGDAGAKQFAPQIRERLTNKDPEVAAAAKAAFAQLHLDEAGIAAKKISELPYADVLAQASAPGGDAKHGQELFTQRACIVCHTISPNDPPKGPMLGGIAQRYSRAELIESILKPSAKIAQGFESQAITMRKGQVVEGFVVREGGDSVEVRNIAGVTTVLDKADIASRERRETSIMPEGLVADLTVADLMALLAYLESTPGK